MESTLCSVNKPTSIVSASVCAVAARCHTEIIAVEKLWFIKKADWICWLSELARRGHSGKQSTWKATAFACCVKSNDLHFYGFVCDNKTSLLTWQNGYVKRLTFDNTRKWWCFCIYITGCHTLAIILRQPTVIKLQAANNKEAKPK